jgi:RNA polymerase-binding transcription factor DksA
MPLTNHRLSWEQRKLLHERLLQRAAVLRLGMDESSGEPPELREIGEALVHLDTAAFGACVDCGAPIAWDRLLARPQLRRCARCLAAVEPPV